MYNYSGRVTLPVRMFHGSDVVRRASVGYQSNTDRNRFCNDPSKSLNQFAICLIVDQQGGVQKRNYGQAIYTRLLQRSKFGLFNSSRIQRN